MEGNALLIQGSPASTTLPLASHLAQLLLTPAVVALAYFVPVPVAMPVVTAVAGRRAADNVPLAMLLAFVVSVGAEGAKPITPLAGTEVAVMVPVPVAESDAPEPMTRAAAVLVPPAKEGNELAAAMAVRTDCSVGMLLLDPGEPTDVTTPRPADKAVPAVLLNSGAFPVVVVTGPVMPVVPLPVPQGAPASTTLPLASHLAQLLLAPAPVALASFVPAPVAIPVVTTLAGRRAAAKVPLAMLLALVVSVVADGASPVTPLAGTEVAAMVPVPVAESDAPEPTTKADVVLVPPLMDGNALFMQGRPASTTLPLASHLAQLLLAPAPVALAYFAPAPVAIPVVTTLAGRRAAANVPLAMLLAFVASVVAEAASPVTPLAGTEVATIVPVPVAERDAPEPITIAAAVFVPPAKDGNVLAAVMAVRTDCSVGRLLLEPGEPTDVTTPRPADKAVPAVLLNCGTLPVVVGPAPRCRLSATRSTGRTGINNVAVSVPLSAVITSASGGSGDGLSAVPVKLSID